MARLVLIVFRWGIFLLACVFLWSNLSAVKGSQAVDAFRALLAGPRSGFLLGIVCLLMPINWALEAGKWQWLVGHLEKVGPLRAFLATIAGTSIALVTPNRTGEFIGRVLFLDPGHRIQGAFATALGSIAQFVVTLFMGGMALVLSLATDRALPWVDGPTSVVIVSLSALVTALCMVFYLQPGLLRQLILLVPGSKRLGKASEVLNGFELHELLLVLVLSAMRYVVFTIQFILLLHLMDSGVDTVDAILAIPLIYLISTMVPTIMLTELGVRGSTAVAVLVPLGGAELPVLLGTTMLWAINLVFPALAGSIILLVVRIRTKRSMA